MTEPQLGWDVVCQQANQTVRTVDFRVSFQPINRTLRAQAADHKAADPWLVGLVAEMERVSTDDGWCRLAGVLTAQQIAAFRAFFIGARSGASNSRLHHLH